jgi:glutathione peroxidase-family protein
MRAFLILLALSTQVFAIPFHQVVEKDIDGKAYPLSALKGKPVLVVNIASQCGYTDQLSDLQKVHQKYVSQGLVVLGVPSNDFGGQTPEDDAGMKEFCQKKYNVAFPLLSKGPVKGSGKRALYTYLADESAKKGDVTWNFTKFLVNGEGVVVARWSASDRTENLGGEIEKLLKK